MDGKRKKAHVKVQSLAELRTVAIGGFPSLENTDDGQEAAGKLNPVWERKTAEAA